MVTVSELEDDDEFDDIVADVREECTRFGVVKSVTIPRKGHGVGRVSAHACQSLRALCPATARRAPRKPMGSPFRVYVCPHAPQVFVEFDNIAQAITASASLNGRLFAQRRVGTEYMNEFTYGAQDFSAFP